MSTHARRRPSLRLSPVAIGVVLVGAALVAWFVSVERMRGMNAGPGTDLGGLGWFVGTWVTMMGAMMLPSVAPMMLVFGRVHRERSRRGKAAFVPTWIFFAGYLVTWTAFGLFAYALYRGIHGLDLEFLAWDTQGPLVAGGAIAAAGLYQLTPLKEVCLRHCRTPLQFVAFHWREGRLGAVQMGAEHGLYCVGCCWGLMLVLFAVGVMSVPWMVAIAALIFVEKVLPFGPRLSRPLAGGFVALGGLVAAAPASAPV